MLPLYIFKIDFHPCHEENTKPPSVQTTESQMWTRRVKRLGRLVMNPAESKFKTNRKMWARMLHITPKVFYHFNILGAYFTKPGNERQVHKLVAAQMLDEAIE